MPRGGGSGSGSGSGSGRGGHAQEGQRLGSSGSNAFKQVRFRDVLLQSSARGSGGGGGGGSKGKTPPPATTTTTAASASEDTRQQFSFGVGGCDGVGVTAAAALLGLALWNIYVVVSLLRTLQEGDWHFTMYFDDAFNFLEHQSVFSFSPVSVARVGQLLVHKGINVYEPVGSVLKALIFNLHGSHPTCFRSWSVVLHFINGFLMVAWSISLLQATRSRSAGDVMKKRSYGCGKSSDIGSNEKGAILVACAAATSLCLVHPLNVEVVAWASAQSYTLALTFYLLALLLFEYFLLLTTRGASTRHLFGVSLAVYSCYVLACLSKAPAVTLPAVQLLRVILLPFPAVEVPTASPAPAHVDQVHNTRGMLRGLFCYSCGMTAIAALTAKIIFVANMKGTQNAVTNYSQWGAKVARAVVTTWNFGQRIFNPQDLRVHYVLPQQSEMTLDNLIFGNNNPHVFAALLAITVTVLLLLHRQRFAVLTLSWLAFLVAWTPGVGLINHGWSSFGADRYCYLPLAMLVPGVAELLLLTARSYPVDNIHDSDIDNTVGRVTSLQKPLHQKQHIAQKDSTHSMSSTINRCVMTVVVLIFLGTFKARFTTYMLCWRNDKFLMESCLQYDAADYHCHYVLSKYYNDYENDKEMSRIHHDLAISYMPDDEPKALLCTAAMYVEVGRLEEGCVIYREMYKTVDEMEAQYRPYVLNNYVACNAAEGVDFVHRQLANLELTKALAVVEEVGDLPSYVKEGVEDHLQLIRRLGQQRGDGDGAVEYGVSFLY